MYFFKGEIIVNNIDNITKEDIRFDFNNGLTKNELCHKYNDITWSKLFQIIEIELRNNISDLSNDDKQDIINLYQNAVPTTDLALKYKINHKKIAKFLRENNIPKNPLIGRTYYVNEHYFDKIDAPNKAYILGFLYADGNNCVQKSTVRMGLQECDKEILDKINKELQNEVPLTFHKKNRWNDCDMYLMNIYSIQICNMLSYYGCIPNKSLKLVYPTFLNDDLHRHFIRGYYDGDGSLHGQIPNNRRTLQATVTLTSTGSFCKTAQQIIREKVGVLGGNIYDASCHNGATRVLSFGGSRQVEKFLDWLYDGADLYLQRKHDRYIQYFKQ